MEWHQSVLRQAEAAAKRAEAALRAAREAAEAAAMIPWAIARRIETARRKDELEADVARAYDAYKAAVAQRNLQIAERRRTPWRTDWPDDPDAAVAAADAAIPPVREALRAFVEGEGARAFEEAFVVLHHCDALKPSMPRWPNTSEEIERRFWNKPRPGEMYETPPYNPMLDPVWMARMGDRNRARRRA